MEERYFEATIKGVYENHPDLKSVDLSTHELSDDKILELAIALKQNEVVETLDLFGVTGVKDAWHQLFEALPPQLITLDFGSCNLAASNSVESLMANLARLQQLEELDLRSSGNGLTQSHDLSAIGKLPNLNELMLQRNYLTLSAIVELTPHLNPKLSALWLQNNAVESDEEKISVRESLKHLNCRLQI